MNKNDLIAALAEKTETTKAAAKTQVETVLELISLRSPAKASLTSGFGKFTTKVNPAKKGRNPATKPRWTSRPRRSPSSLRPRA